MLNLFKIKKEYQEEVSANASLKDKINNLNKELEKTNAELGLKKLDNYRLTREIHHKNELIESKIQENICLENKLNMLNQKYQKLIGRVGGLTKQRNASFQTINIFKDMLAFKDRDLKQASTIIQNLNIEMKSLKNRPTMKELKEYEITRKSPRKNKKNDEGGKENV